MYSLLAFDLPNNEKKSKTFESNDLAIFSPFKSHPLFKLGYHHFIERTRSALNIKDKLESKKEFYYVVNEFETSISDYEDSIENLTKIYFGDKNLVFGRDFYKLWEMLFIFNIINSKTKSISIISNDSGDCMDSINYFSDKILNINSSKFDINNININQEKEFEYNKNNQNQFLNKIKKSDNFSAPSKFIKSKKTSDIVIANSENYYTSINSKEDESYKLLLGELLVILNSLNKEGSIILKVFDTFTTITLKIIYIIYLLFDEIYIYKPFLSRLSDSEKYIVCKGYNYDSSDKYIKKIITMIEKILSDINTEHFLNDIFIDIELPEYFYDTFKFINIKLVNQQQILINDMVVYIKENNYYGDKFHEYRNKQIEATKWWVKLFYPPSNNIYQTNKETLKTNLKLTIDKNNADKEKFLSNFV